MLRYRSSDALLALAKAIAMQDKAGGDIRVKRFELLR
jgi:hypothetical protein